MASIEMYETRQGRRYRVRYRKPDGSATDKRGFPTKRAAQAFAATVEVSKLDGSFVDPAHGRITVAELGEQWLVRQKGHMKPSSWSPLEVAWRLRVQPRWGATPIRRIAPSEVQAWVAEMTAGADGRKPAGASVVIRTYGVLAAILDDAVRDRLLPANPARGAKLPRKTRAHKTYLTHEQVWQLAAVAEPPRSRAMVLLLAYSGMRWGEMRALRGADVDLTTRRVQVRRNVVNVDGRDIEGTPKNSKARTLFLPASVVLELRAAHADCPADGLFFPGEDGGFQPRTHTGSGWFEKAVAAAGLPRVTPHDLRHTAASLAVQAGANVKALQRMLGHSSAAMTLDVYADLFDDDLEAVATKLDSAVRAASVGKMWARPVDAG